MIKSDLEEVVIVEERICDGTLSRAHEVWLDCFLRAVRRTFWIILPRAFKCFSPSKSLRSSLLLSLHLHIELRYL
jgi:hypothetical protein